MDYHPNNNQNSESEINEIDRRYQAAAAENAKTPESITTLSLNSNNNTEPCLVSEVLSLGPSRIHDCDLAKITLGHALRLFQVHNLLHELDKELQAVNNQGRSILDIRAFFNHKINVLFEALFSKFIHDGRKDSTKVIEWQTGVTLVNGALIALYNQFVQNTEWSTADFRFSSCFEMEIGILNDDELLSRINNHKVLLELCSLSSIKHEKVIPNIKKFVQLSHRAVIAFISGENRRFSEAKELAFESFHALLFEYEKLVKDLRQLYRRCEKDLQLISIKDSVWKALVDNGKRMRWMTRLKDQPFISNSLFLHECHGKNLEAAILEYTYLLSTCQKVAQKSSPRRKPKDVEPYYECDDRGYVNFVDSSLFEASSKTNNLNTQKNSQMFLQSATSLENVTNFFQNPYNNFPSSRLQKSDQKPVLRRSHTFHEVSSLSRNPATAEVKRLLSNVETYSDTIKISKSESPHRRLLHSLASYICHGTSLSKVKALEILHTEFNVTKVCLDEEASYWLFTDTLDEYIRQLQKELLYGTVFEDFDHEMDKFLICLKLGRCAKIEVGTEENKD